MKSQLTFKSLAELPANTLTLTAAMPGRAVNVPKAAAATVPPAGRRLRVTDWQSRRFVAEIRVPGASPFRRVQPWHHGGLND